MGKRFFRIKLNGRDEETLPFGTIIQTQHGTNSWFMTMHMPMKRNHLLCHICNNRISSFYMRSHTMRFEMTGRYAYERVCANCLPGVIRNRSDVIERLEVFQMVDGQEQSMQV